MINDYQWLLTIINDYLRLSINDGKTGFVENVILTIGLTIAVFSDSQQCKLNEEWKGKTKKKIKRKTKN